MSVSVGRIFESVCLPVCLSVCLFVCLSVTQKRMIWDILEVTWFGVERPNVKVRVREHRVRYSNAACGFEL